MKKRTSYAIFAVAILALSCVTPAPPIPFATPVLRATKSPAVVATVESVCAEAVTGLHVRSDTDASADVLTWLENGEQVEVLDAPTLLWYKVRFGNVTGYSRSKYLTIVSCRKGER